jgi:TRAP-type uncharacterized transport system substrate-binding protein
MSSFIERYRRRRFVIWLIVGIVFGVLLLLNVVWLGVGPPKEVSISSGDPGAGAYHSFALKYKDELDRLGLDTTIHTSKGSEQNLDRLLNKKVDVAFVQSGLLETDNRDHSELRGLAAVYLSPVWVFYRKEVGELDRISNFKDLTISIGPEGSGTNVIAKRLLTANGVDTRGENIRSLDMKDAANALEKNEIQIAIFVVTSKSPQVRTLLSNPDIRLLDFRRSLAYARKFPEFSPVILGEGTVDLEANIPGREYRLVATSVILMAREDLHARAVEQILLVARKVHKKGDILSDPDSFPTLDRVTMPVHPAAKQFIRSGEAWTTKILPYAVMRWVLRIQLLIIPLLAIWLPLVKFFPAIYRFRINSLLKLHYAALREAENQIKKAKTSEDLLFEIENVSKLQQDMERLSRKIPAHLQRDVYNWRLHIALVRDEAVNQQAALAAEGVKTEPQTEPEDCDQ